MKMTTDEAVKRAIERVRIEESEGWRGWCDKIPYIKFPQSWEVRPIPPFAGALVRFTVRKGKAHVSVYLDVDNSLGFFCDDDGAPLPYWEVYPSADDDVYRCEMDQTFALIHAIAESFKANPESREEP